MNRFIFSFFILLATKAEAQSSALAISDSLYAVGNYSEAISPLEQLRPKSENVYLKLATVQQAKGDPTATLRDYKIVPEKDSENANLIHLTKRRVQDIREELHTSK